MKEKKTEKKYMREKIQQNESIKASEKKSIAKNTEEKNKEKEKIFVSFLT